MQSISIYELYMLGLLSKNEYEIVYFYFDSNINQYKIY